MLEKLRKRFLDRASQLDPRVSVASLNELQTQLAQRLNNITIAVTGRNQHIVFTLLSTNQTLQFSLQRENIFFATGGAKEIQFRLTPVELAPHAEVRECARSLCSFLAQHLWQEPIEASWMHIEIENGIVRCDLRTALSAALKQDMALSHWVDMISLERLRVEGQTLTLWRRINMPALQH